MGPMGPMGIWGQWAYGVNGHMGFMGLWGYGVFRGIWDVMGYGGVLRAAPGAIMGWRTFRALRMVQQRAAEVTRCHVTSATALRAGNAPDSQCPAQPIRAGETAHAP